MSEAGLVRIDDTTWEIPASARQDMRVPARIFADDEILAEIEGDLSLEQLQNVATLPGVVDAAIAMPDIHQGYGFPVGGVAATELPDGVVSPGGVGYDINCGVRLLALPVSEPELGDRREALVHQISRDVPSGAGKSSGLSLSKRALDDVLRDGPRSLPDVRPEDVERTESEGRLDGADPGGGVRARAAARPGPARNDGIRKPLRGAAGRRARCSTPPRRRRTGSQQGQVTVLIHSGSRGLGHQVCTDYVRLMDGRLASYRIHLPDRQLACAPASSTEGRRYLAAMAAAANFAWANRQAIADRVRRAIASVLGEDAAEGTRQVYDVAHNVAKVESHGGRTLCVHRKGATRAFAAGSEEIPAAYRAVGQPVFIPGSMGTASFVLAGEPGAMERTFGTTCHGAGRRLSRTAARKQIEGGELRRQLEARGIVVRCPSAKGLAEEAPFAYKDVDRVVRVVERAGLARRVARLVPIGVVKG